MAKKKAAPKKSFEEHLKQLEEIVEALESGELPLEESIRKYEVGVAALKECYAILNDAEKKIETITKTRSGPKKKKTTEERAPDEEEDEDNATLF